MQSWHRPIALCAYNALAHRPRRLGQDRMLQMHAYPCMSHLELACSAQPHVVHAGQLGHAVAGLVHRDAAHVAADELVRVEVHVAVADAAPVPSPPHLRSHARASGCCIMIQERCTCPQPTIYAIGRPSMGFLHL